MDKGDRRKHIPASRGLILCVIKHSVQCKQENTTPVTHSESNVPTDRHCINEKPFSMTAVDY